MRRARPGDPAGIFDTGKMYRLPEHAEGQLLVGDETALPAILSILDRTPPPPATQVYLEVATEADIRSVETPAGVLVHWFSRDDPERRPGAVVLDAVRDETLPRGRFYTWVAGESRLATTVRRHLVNDRGVPKQDITFVGYWRLGRSAPG